jgi:hypothetical protein
MPSSGWLHPIVFLGWARPGHLQNPDGWFPWWSSSGGLHTGKGDQIRQKGIPTIQWMDQIRLEGFGRIKYVQKDDLSFLVLYDND